MKSRHKIRYFNILISFESWFLWIFALFEDWNLTNGKNAVFKLLVSPKSISRKIWMAEKSWIFYTVKGGLGTTSTRNLRDPQISRGCGSPNQVSTKSAKIDFSNFLTVLFHSVSISGFFCYLDFTSNQFWSCRTPKNCHFRPIYHFLTSWSYPKLISRKIRVAKLLNFNITIIFVVSTQFWKNNKFSLTEKNFVKSTI